MLVRRCSCRQVNDSDEVTAFTDAMLNGSEKWSVQKMAIDDEVIVLFGNLKYRGFYFQVCASRIYFVGAVTFLGEAS